MGGFAAVLYGSPFVTTDIDVVPASDEDNLARLSGCASGSACKGLGGKRA